MKLMLYRPLFVALTAISILCLYQCALHDLRLLAYLPMLGFVIGVVGGILSFTVPRYVQKRWQQVEHDGLVYKYRAQLLLIEPRHHLDFIHFLIDPEKVADDSSFVVKLNSDDRYQQALDEAIRMQCSNLIEVLQDMRRNSQCDT